jgi:hypothetical protein
MSCALANPWFIKGLDSFFLGKNVRLLRVFRVPPVLGGLITPAG